METEKKQWTKPELTVLVRNNAEEAVLTGCKQVLGFSGTPLLANIGCFDPVSICTACTSISAS
jgi:hypothetical protein